MAAAKQVQKTRLAHPVTQTALSQAQSQEVVQVLVHSALSGLSYRREFFSESAFDHQRLSTEHGIPPYRAYADGTLPAEKGRSVDIQVLRRGRSKRADLFLDWLEKGVFAALRDHRLARVRIFAHPSPEEREKILEAYTFSIRYHAGEGGNGGLAGLEVDSPGRGAVTVEATNEALQELLRYVQRICEQLPGLPEKRYISMMISYREDSAKAVELVGFEPKTTNNMMVASADGWEMTARSPERLDSAFHIASFAVTHLRQPGLEALQPFAQPNCIPTRLRYQDGEPINPALAAEHHVDEHDSNATATPASEPSTIVPVTQERVAEQHRSDAQLKTPAPTAPAVKQVRLERVHGAACSPRTFGKLNFNDSLDTQTSDAPRMKRAARSFMLPEHYTQGDTQTQPPMHAHSPAHGHFASPRQSLNTNGEEEAPRKLQLLTAMKRQLQRSKGELKKSAMQLATRSVLASGGSHLILCQCGHDEEEGTMVQCSYCDTWQHLHCYGFTGNQDRRLPDGHACYKCIVGTTDPELMAALVDLTLKRRAMHHALQNGLSTKAALGDFLGIGAASADPIWQYLHDEGFVEPTPRTRKSRVTSSKKHLFVAVQQGPTGDKMLRALFEPLREIGSYYYDAFDPAREDQPSVYSPIMPPPKVPASQMKKGREVLDETTSSPSSDLDIGTSKPRFDSPIRSRDLPLKRLQQEDNFSTPSKRQSRWARVKTLQSICVLNADGLSSSPTVSTTPRQERTMHDRHL